MGSYSWDQQFLLEDLLLSISYVCSAWFVINLILFLILRWSLMEHRLHIFFLFQWRFIGYAFKQDIVAFLNSCFPVSICCYLKFLNLVTFGFRDSWPTYYLCTCLFCYPKLKIPEDIQSCLFVLWAKFKFSIENNSWMRGDCVHN